MSAFVYRRSTPLAIRLYAMRHGPAEHNALRVTASRIETDTHALLPESESLVRPRAQLLRGMGIVTIYASDFRRAKQTAEIVGEVLGVPVVEDERLREINLGVLDGMREDSPAFAEFSKRWISDPTYKPTGGESQQELATRLSAFVDDADRRHRGASVLAVSHSGPIWNLLATLYTIDWPRANAGLGKIHPADIIEVYPDVAGVRSHDGS